MVAVAFRLVSWPPVITKPSGEAKVRVRSSLVPKFRSVVPLRLNVSDTFEEAAV